MFDDLSGKGSLFHSLGPAAEEALSPYVFRDVLTEVKDKFILMQSSLRAHGEK